MTYSFGLRGEECHDELGYNPGMETAVEIVDELRRIRRAMGVTQVDSQSASVSESRP